MDMLSVLTNVKCGGYEFDAILPGLTSTIITIIKIGIPLILIFLGMLDLGKAVMSNDEKTMKESQSRLIKRFVYALVVFLLVAIVQLVFSMLDNAAETSDVHGVDTGDNITACINCFVNGDCTK